MRIIHLISDCSRLNFGVWNVVIASFPYLEEMGWETEIWFPKGNEVPGEFSKLKYRIISKTDDTGLKDETGKRKQEDRSQLKEPGFHTSNFSKLTLDLKNQVPALVVSHGCWGWATRTGLRMKQMGFRWIAYPHGMLESWSLQQKWLKKKIYYQFIEYPGLKKADAIVAVSKPEYGNLLKQFSHVFHIPNGIIPAKPVKKYQIDKLDIAFPVPGLTQRTDETISGSSNEEAGMFNPIVPFSPDPQESLIQPGKSSIAGLSPAINFIFLGRLHYKKGVVPLVKAWLKSSMNNDQRYNLIIAGPDDGELGKIRDIVGEEIPKSDMTSKNHESGGEKSEAGIRRTELSDANSAIKKASKAKSDHQSRSSNIFITGPVYGIEKDDLLAKSGFFILPSQSEGFPTSIVEAMTHGCICIFTEGCNFPEAFNAGVGVRIKPDEENIRLKLEEIREWKIEQIEVMSGKSKKFADDNYHWKDIALRQGELYLKTLNKT